MWKTGTPSIHHIDNHLGLHSSGLIGATRLLNRASLPITRLVMEYWNGIHLLWTSKDLGTDYAGTSPEGCNPLDQTIWLRRGPPLFPTIPSNLRKCVTGITCSIWTCEVVSYLLVACNSQYFTCLELIFVSVMLNTCILPIDGILNPWKNHSTISSSSGKISLNDLL